MTKTRTRGSQDRRRWVGKASTTSVTACTGRAPIPPFALTDRSYPNTNIAEKKTMYSEPRHPIPEIESDYLNELLMKKQSFPLFILAKK